MEKHNLFYGHDGKYEEIDREEEDKLVTKYQETKSEQILEDVFLARVPTLINWVNKEYYPGLDISEEDFFSEMTNVFLKAMTSYNIERGSFNTCLWNFMSNRIKNMKNATHAKKRRPEGLKGSLINATLSLDYSLDNEDSEAHSELHNFLSVDDPDCLDKLKLEEMIDHLSHGDKDVYDALFAIAHGESISSVLRRNKVKDVVLEDTNASYNKLEIVKILKNTFNKDFKLLKYDYDVKGHKHICKLEFKKTESADKISKQIRFLKSNKKEYIEQILI